MTQNTPLLSLEAARTIARRAVDKAEDLSQAGTYVVVDAAGHIVTASRMDGTGQLSFFVARAKAYAAAVHRADGGLLNSLYSTPPTIHFHAMNFLAPKRIFPGAGARVVREDGRAIGAFSTGMGVVPFVKFPGVDPQKLITKGRAANAEDICSAYAMDQDYVPQHGDDEQAWVQAYGGPPEGEGRGLEESPRATKQPQLDAAIRLSDAVMAEAKRRNAVVCVAVLDQDAEVVQIDRMDGASPMTPDIALSLAVTALNFGGASESAAAYPDLEALARATTFKFLAVPGGLAITEGGRITGAIGVGGTDPAICRDIARAVIEAL